MREGVQRASDSSPKFARQVLYAHSSVLNPNASSAIGLAVATSKGRRFGQSGFKLVRRLGQVEVQMQIIVHAFTQLPEMIYCGA
ncbi:hypothetical protein GCM10027048_30520 [Hymenobacter coalescens]